MRRDKAVRSVPDPAAEVARLRTELERLTAALETSRATTAALEALAHEDPLTGLLNRRGFLRDLDRALSYCRRYATPAALLLLDLDRFKPINDCHGHAVGDLALKHVSGLLRANLRASDSVGRLGGDEFAILLWQVDPVTARTKADMLEATLAAGPLSHEGASLAVEGSIGSAPLVGGTSADEILRQADRAMYLRKAERAAPPR